MEQNKQNILHIDITGIVEPSHKYQKTQICMKSSSKNKKKENNENIEKRYRQVIKLGNRRKKIRTQNETQTEQTLKKKLSLQRLDKKLRSAQEKDRRQTRYSYLLHSRTRKNSLKSNPSQNHLQLRTQTSLKSLKGLKRSPQNEQCSFLKCFEESAKKYNFNGFESELNKRRRNQQSLSRSKSKKSAYKCSNGTKLEKRLEKMKQYKFVQRYLTDLQLEGLFKKYELAEIPQIRWPLLIVDQVYCLMKKDEINPNRVDIRRDR